MSALAWLALTALALCCLLPMRPRAARRRRSRRNDRQNHSLAVLRDAENEIARARADIEWERITYITSHWDEP